MNSERVSTTPKKKVSVKKKITETGADGRLSASISHRGFKWKKKSAELSPSKAIASLTVPFW